LPRPFSKKFRLRRANGGMSPNLLLLCVHSLPGLRNHEPPLIHVYTRCIIVCLTSQIFERRTLQTGCMANKIIFIFYRNLYVVTFLLCLLVKKLCAEYLLNNMRHNFLSLFFSDILCKAMYQRFTVSPLLQLGFVLVEERERMM
jgi:hypothetical protein